jgi:glycosyltransferase involved in cell wall biosynthesis
MKIIALTPVKNESWILPTYLSSIKKIADEIITIDDGSTDNSIQILRDAGVFVYDNKEVVKSGWAEHSIRQNLLKLGREHGGTHFICLDADEVLSANFIKNARDIIKKLQPGQKLLFRWVNLWKNINYYRNDNSPFGYIVKDFIFCDDNKSSHDYAFLGVGRTPGKILNNNSINITQSEGVVLHFQFFAWNMTQLKQAWYRCSELIKGERNAKIINNTYSITLNNPKAKLSPMLEEWIKDIILPKAPPKTSWHLEKILSWFDEYGIEFFEPLQIWHIPELHNEFIKKINRKPKIQTYPKWLVTMNNFKNKIKNK